MFCYANRRTEIATSESDNINLFNAISFRLVVDLDA